MKKIILLVLMVLILCSGMTFADKGDKEKAEERNSRFEYEIKTYMLKHVSPSVVERTLRQYIMRASYTTNGNMFTVKIFKKHVADFEALLKKLDVKKQKVMLRIFTIVASKEKGQSTPIDNKDLRKVLAQLQGVLSFNSYRLDGLSAMNIRDEQRESSLKLASQSNLSLELKRIYIRKGEKNYEIGFNLRLTQQMRDGSTGKFYSETLIHSQTSVNENGYLVAGVSKIGKNGDSLILVINAKMK
jgi:hypothetical protein